MLAAFATLGGLSVVETSLLREQLFVASSSSEAMGGLRSLERDTNAFLRAESGAGEAGSVRRMRDNIGHHKTTLKQLAQAVSEPAQAASLRAAVAALAALDERIAAIAGARPIKDAAGARVLTGAGKVIAGVSAAQETAAREASETQEEPGAAQALSHAAIGASALGLVAGRFVEAPSAADLELLEQALADVRLNLDAAIAQAAGRDDLIEHLFTAQTALLAIDNARETVLRLSQEEDSFRRDAVALVQDVENAAVEVARLMELKASERSETAAAAVIGALALGLLAWMVGLFVARNRLLLPFRGLTRAMERLSKGDLSVVAEGAGRRDEIGAMARALEVFRSDALNVRQLQSDREAQEIAQRAQIEALLGGIKVLNDEESIPGMFEGVLGTLSRLVDYDEAAILVENNKGRFVALATTSPAFRPEIEPPKAGEDGLCVMDKLQLLEDSDYRLASKIKGLGFRAAVLAPLNAHSRRAMMVCAKRDIGAYGDNEISAIRAFTPVAEQAVRNAEQLDELETAVHELDAMAHHDALTGLKNRKSFIIEIDRRKAQADAREDQGFALFHIDLDHFKVINDAIGHAAGDYALKWAAGVIAGCVRDEDVVARLGGDEFAVICDENEAEPLALLAIADKLVQELSKPFEYEGKSLQMGASIGIGRYPIDSDDPGQILHIADMALLESKAGGRGRYAFFTVALRRELERRQAMEFKLHEAVANNELELWYQPIVCMKTQKVESFEALVRWRNSKFGLLEPSVFIPVAERAGLMTKIGEWVIRTACEDMKAWLSQDPERRIAVNVAAAQLSSPNFVPFIDTVMKDVGLAPGSLELELSEEITLRRSAELALDNLMALHERGYQIAFDDFGTGYTSLAHLRQFPGQRMKIDRSFVMGCCASETVGADPALTRGLVVLAQSLGMAVVAEGVETLEQLNFCQQIGCEEAQGFLFGKPSPLEEALAMAARIGTSECEVWRGAAALQAQAAAAAV